MKMSFIHLMCVGVLIFGSIGCKRAAQEEDQTSSNDNAKALASWNDISNQTLGSAFTTNFDSAKTKTWVNCATLYLDTTPGIFPNAVTLDFGTTNCKGSDGQYRRGQLIYTINAPISEVNSTIVLTPNDYFLNDNKIEGKLTLTNQGLNSKDQLEIGLKVENGYLKFADATDMTWESSRTITWIEGQNTHFFTFDSASNSFLLQNGLLDDVFSMDGSASGVDRNGRSFDVNITDPLIAKANCKYIVSGTIEIKPEDLEKRVFDYGSGDCDAKATLTIKDKVKEISL